MKSLLILLFLSAFSTHMDAQSLRVKRKYYKTYEGEMPTYNVLLGTEIVEIPTCKIALSLTKDSVFFQLGQLKFNNSFQLEKTGSPDEICIIVLRENSDIPERFILNTKEKSILRKGISPQPDVKLTKVKKSR